VPSVIILNSVVSAIALEDKLVEAGILRDEIAPIRGLSARSSRDVNGKLIVIGTAAIEVGIDFQADYLLFEAGDAASFMQRFGRIGRHRSGKALLLCSHREADALESLGTDISRNQLENQVALTYTQQDARAWFISTFSGMISVCAQAQNFKRIITEDRSADNAMKERINYWIDEKLINYAMILGAESNLKRARLRMKREWFAHYAEIQTFRTSLPSVEVWDRDEKYERGRDPNYSADIKTLLTRAKVRWNDKYKRMEIKDGYNHWHHVWFVKSFDDMPERIGVIETTGDARYLPEQMQFMQAGHLTSVSHLMHHPKFHIFVFAPYSIKDRLDWRIAWFRCGAQGRYLIAFDGDALLLKEIYEQSLK